MYFIRCQGGSVGESVVSFEAFFDDLAGFGDRNIGEERFNIETDHDVCIVYGGLGEDIDEMLGVIDVVLRLSYEWLENLDYFFCDGNQLHNWAVVCDFTIDCDDGTDEKGCERVLTQGESVNVSSTYHSGGGYILWKLTLADAPNLAFLIEPLYSYFYDGSHLVFGYGHDPNTNSSRTWNVTYRDGYYYSYQSGAHEKHLLNSSDMFIEYQYSTYAYDYFEFQITAVEARDYMYCDSEPTTEVSLRTAQCDGVADCMNSNDEYMCDPHEVSPGDILKLQSYGYTYHTAGQTSSVTWSLIATDNNYVLLRFAILAITPNDTLCVGEGNNPQNASSTITCISGFLSLGPWVYSEYELMDVYASVLAPPASNGLWRFICANTNSYTQNLGYLT
eukprot:XP_011672286.1 PREDICTED: uncharacterized protein LOC105442134 [Strongylocentrotus purpuratus]